jgi:hypothetical protein
MVPLSAAEVDELLDDLARYPASRPAGQSMAVSANASTSVTFTNAEKAAVFEVLARRLEDPTRDADEGLQRLKASLAHDLGLR